MYSVILATVLATTAGPTQQWGGGFGWNYCQGRSSCSGCGGCQGCYGWQGGYGCQGCYGGCQGCSGGWGYQCSGYQGCYGCSGCQGCYGCQGGGYQGWGYGLSYGNLSPQAAYAMYGTNGPYQAYSIYGSQMYQGCVGSNAGCYGCYGGWSCFGTPIVVTPAIPTRRIDLPSENLVPPKEVLTPPKEIKEEKKLEKIEDKKEEKKNDGGNKKDPLKLEVLNKVGGWATIVMQVPADAKVFIDDQPMTATSTRRVYQTPILEEGETYFYDIRVEVVRAGKTLAESRRVTLTPGQRLAANFEELGSTPPALAQNEED